jgi:putative ATP-dependent endonuclease of OLD family
MKLSRYYIRNFRRLEDVAITLEDDDTIFVGPNNSAKTSATSAFRLFVAQSSDLKIHDFSSFLMSNFDACEFAANDVPEAGFPTMELDLWFEIDPTTEYGRVSSILSSVGILNREIGLRIRLSADDPTAMLAAYRTVYPPSAVDGVKKSAKTLSHFLSEGTHFKRYFSFKYFSLECTTSPFSAAAVNITPLEKDFGKAALTSLLRVDFVEAHRNIDDIEVSRSNRLSSVFADFYKSNLEQLDFDAAAISVINQSNDQLTANYKVQFKSLFDVIGRLGFPSIHDRSLLLLSSINPDSALRGNTTLRYEETGSGHQLPESYNGLGFKNMIFMAIQITHFQKRWICTEKNRPLCQVIFIEEPEVHLHAQVQQAFIRQIAEITKATATEHKTPTLKPQLIVTTHSSHILDEVDFTKVRYFRRVQSRYAVPADPTKPVIKTATQVLSLRDFVPVPPDADDEPSEAQLAVAQTEALDFLKKYLKLTHCDLFFSDAAILVEGTVERLLFPIFIKNQFEGLKAAYLTVLEVGGAFAHLFIPLVDFIGLPTLIITDLDSVDPAMSRQTCRADKPGAVTSNTTLSAIYKTNLVAELLLIPAADRIKSKAGNQRFITYQTSIAVTGYAGKTAMIPRTFEESFIYTNLPAVRSGRLKTFTPLPAVLDFEADYNSVYEAVKSKGYKKVEFALQQLATNHKWLTPTYICDGLDWLNKVVAPLTLGTLVASKAP